MKIELQCVHETNNNGQLISESFWLNGKRHNPNGPAYREWNTQGQLIIEDYFINGKWHNPNGPAYRRWNNEGQLIWEEYWLNDERHNPHGPAVRKWNDEGQLIQEYWIDGKKLTKEQFDSSKNTCSGKIVVIDGVEYKLTPI